MFDAGTKKITLQRLTEARAQLLREYPFFGTLLMHLKIGLAECETAYTDMRRIVFDPAFVQRLDNRQLQFVMCHEVMHCVLDHCIRARGHIPYVYNIASDIVVNSNIMAVWGVPDFLIDGEEAIHLAPDGKEGYNYSAEEVYAMLLQQQCVDDGNDDEGEEENGSGNQNKDEDGTPSLDRHDFWAQVEPFSSLPDEWKGYLEEAGAADAKEAGNITFSLIRKLLEDYEEQSKINWKEALHNFIQLHYDNYDYSFTPADRRYSWSEFVVPAFHECETEVVENVWFCVDASGSVSDEMLNMVMNEIKQALIQLDGLSGWISFFDTIVTEPVEFDSIETLNSCEAVGGGGTSFYAIFRYMREHMEEDLPVAVIILTDGYAEFPPEKAACDVPVLWIIVESEREPEWGKVIHI